MDSMRCWDCLLKHLAAAVSYGKEVLSGHGRGNELDHRIDFLGEIINAEQHAEALDAVLLRQISVLRKMLQNTHVSIDVKVIDDLRNLYIKTETQEELEFNKTNKTALSAPVSSAPPAASPHLPVSSKPIPQFVPVIRDSDKPPLYGDPLDVVYEQVTNLDFFRFSYYSMQRFLQPHGKIFILKDEVELVKNTEFADVIIANKTLLEFCRNSEVSKDFLYVKENMAWVNPEDSRKSYPMYSILYNNEMTKTKQELRRTGVEDRTRVYDNMKPQPINKDNYAVVMENIGETTHPLVHYYTLTTRAYSATIIDDRFVTIDRPVCCSTRSRLRNGTWATWTNNDNFISMKTFLEKERGLIDLLPAAPETTETPASSASSEAPASSQASSQAAELPKIIVPTKPVPEPPPKPPVSSVSSQEKK